MSAALKGRGIVRFSKFLMVGYMSDSRSSQDGARGDAASWKEIVLQCQKPSTGRAVWQLVNTLGPYALLWYLMYRSLAISYWLTLPLGILAGGFLVRVFIIFHDCGHGSFFKSRLANDILGCFTGVLCFTPYYQWRWEHAVHHSAAGDLDRRGTGDVWTLTVQEYLEASRWKRFAYRLARNPFVLFVLAPLFLFLIQQRFPSGKGSLREQLSVYGTNVVILLMTAGMSAIFGWKAFLLLQLVVVTVAGSAGVW